MGTAVLNYVHEEYLLALGARAQKQGNNLLKHSFFDTYTATEAGSPFARRQCNIAFKAFVHLFVKFENAVTNTFRAFLFTGRHVQSLYAHLHIKKGAKVLKTRSTDSIQHYGGLLIDEIRLPKNLSLQSNSTIEGFCEHWNVSA